MAARLSDGKKKMVIADFAETGCYSETARRFGINESTVRRLCRKEPEIMKKAEEKRDQNTLDMLEYMDSRKVQAQSVIDKCLEALDDEEKLKGASLSQIATALGIVVDKFTKSTPAGESTLNKLDEVLNEIGGVI